MEKGREIVKETSDILYCYNMSRDIKMWCILNYNIDIKTFVQTRCDCMGEKSQIIDLKFLEIIKDHSKLQWLIIPLNKLIFYK